MKIFKIILLGLLMTGVSVEALSARSNTLSKKQLQKYQPLKINQGKSLKSLKTAKLGDVHLAKPVKYFDIRHYYADGAYDTGYSFDMAAYNKFTKKEKKKMVSVRLIKPRSGFWSTSFMDGGTSGYYNLHYMDKSSKVHTINSRKELLAFLGTIDTPVELSILLLGEANGKIRYKRVDDVYIVREHHIAASDCDGCNEPACSLSVRHKVMDKRGNILVSRWTYSKEYDSEKVCEKL